MYHCPECAGRAAGMSVLRRMGSKKSIQGLWLLARKGSGTPGADCPACRRAMVELDLPLANCPQPLRLDVCADCQFVWFDPREIDELPPPVAKAEQPLPQKGREVFAMQQLRRVAEKAEAEKTKHAEHYPDKPWQWIPAMWCMPAEQNAPGLASRPWLTYGLAAVLAAVYALTFGNLEAVIAEYGLAPAEMWRLGGATFITSFFLHGGLLYLIANVYFLLVFGDNVEDDLGWWRYAALLAVAALVGDAVRIFGDPQSTVPCVGASVGISGVITYYALRFPRSRMRLMIIFLVFFRYSGWFSVPAWAALVIWFLVQFVFSYAQQLEIDNVANLAHLGGAAVGLAAWLLWQAGGARSEE